MILATREEFALMYQRLDKSEQLLVSKSLERLEASTVPVGKPLRGGLANCRSIRTGHNSRLRIVYQPIGEVADLVAVGPREGSVVYIVALEIISS